MFVGRESELKELSTKLMNDRFESVLIYGRRRVGKTALIDESLKSYQGQIIRYECKKTTIYQNLVLLSKTIISAFDDLPKNYVFESYDDLFDYVFKKSCENKLLFVIDEFSFLLDDNEAIDSSLAVAIDKYKRDSKMKLLISGSSVQVLKKMISGNEHLYGRFTSIIVLNPLNYLESSKFYENYSEEDKVKMYSVFGGVPYFNSLIDSTKSAEENIINLIVKKDSILEHEINEVVLNETNKINEMNMIINLIARGVVKYSDMVSKLGKDQIRLDYYLKKLMEMEVVERIAPINDKKNKKKTFYIFKDNLMHFYYRYVFDNYDMRNVMNSTDFYEVKIKKNFESEYIPLKFENIAKEYLILANFKHLIEPLVWDVGTFFYDDSVNKRNVQLGVVTLDENGYISYECKYTNYPVDMKVIQEEERQTIGIGMNIYKLGFFAKSGFENIDGDKYNCISLKDMYEL